MGYHTKDKSKSSCCSSENSKNSCSCDKARAHEANHKHPEYTHLGRVSKVGHEQSKFHHICGDQGCRVK